MNKQNALQQALAGFQQGLKDYNTKQPSVVGNLLTGTAWNQGIQRFGGVAPKNQMIENPNVISPVSTSDQLTQGLIYKIKSDQQFEQNAKTPSNFVPKTVQYPAWMANAPTPTSTPKQVVGKTMAATTPTPAPQYNATTQEILKRIMAGYQKMGNPPIATQAGNLATLGAEVQRRGGNPYLPAALALKETGGLRYGPAQTINNPFGIGPGVKYPDLKTAILGGNNQQGLRGVLLNGIYDEYLKTGNLQDFFKRYTPVDAVGHNNPSYKDQIALMNELLSNFEK